MHDEEYCIYSHTNKVNGKVYIGQTCLKPENRWRNGKGYYSGTHFRNAIDKYGWDNFEHHIIKNGLSKNEADYWETFYISFYNSMDKRFGYNMSSGGSNGGHPQTEETRKKISKHHVGMDSKKHTQEAISRMSKAKTGKNHPNYGKHLSDETKNKISEAHRKLRNRKIFCVELDCVFGSLTEAAENTHCFKSAIVECCKGNRKTSNGYHFRYAN